ncbi:MAG: serine/threonine protein kinase, partial [Deltaproteobacteria bacterium]|nr:serine/threonine protein kinase [Deltaproteobacteria bacterium]
MTHETARAPGKQALPTGTTIGRYEILQALGSGGMSTVYRACLHGPAGASKTVALKVIHPDLSRHAETQLMFLDEMRTTMALSHRNLVQTFDAGNADGLPFLVMELVDGVSLEELLTLETRKRLPIDLALYVAAEVAAGLEYAHRSEAGVLHRDVSPGNVLISKHGDVKLADFGVAKAAGQLAEDPLAIKCKLSHMAPEQAHGQEI